MELVVTIYDPDGTAHQEVETDYVSLVNNSTYGPPPLIAPSPRKDATDGVRAAPGETVMYINTALVSAFKIERLAE